MTRPSHREVVRPVTRAIAGKAIDPTEAAALLAATGAEPDRLTGAAAKVRDAGRHGIPFTTGC